MWVRALPLRAHKKSAPDSQRRFGASHNVSDYLHSATSGFAVASAVVADLQAVVQALATSALLFQQDPLVP